MELDKKEGGGGIFFHLISYILITFTKVKLLDSLGFALSILLSICMLFISNAILAQESTSTCNNNHRHSSYTQLGFTITRNQHH